MNTSWDLWNHRCHKRHLPGNYRELRAREHLDSVLLQELHQGSTDTPINSHYLFEYEEEDLLDLDLSCKQDWLRCVEAARAYTRILADDTATPYAPERSLLRQWLATGRY